MSFTYIQNLLPSLLKGTGVSVTLFFISILLSLPLGFLVTMMAKCRVKPVKWFAEAYIYVVRGTPLLLQLMFIYYALPNIPGIGKYLVMDRFVAACLGFVLNYAAYFAEIFRGGLLAIDKGQYEAAKVLGFSRFQTTTRIILPQMFRVALPSITNESITLVKDTSLLYAVAVPDLLHYASVAVTRDFNITPFLIAGIIYLMMTLVLTLFFRWLEKRFKFAK